MLAKSISGAAAAVQPAFIEDVFSTFLYTGNGSTQTITNDIDLSGKGGLVWIKGRSGATGHRLTDTARGATKSLESNSIAAEVTESIGLTAFNGTGFTIGTDADYNTSSATYASWAFRKQSKFFDVVTFTSNGSGNATFSHNLGATPGCVILKRVDGVSSWYVWHRSLTSTNYSLQLQSTAAEADNGYAWITPSSSTISFNGGFVWPSGSQWVAYLFAHDAGGFGLTGTDNVISCGSYTATGNTTVTLGWEPQWILTKKSDGTDNWFLVDNMRGLGATASIAAPLFPNLSIAESTGSFSINATGFTDTNNGSGTFIYIAIRRGPMRVPTLGTSVYNAIARAGTGAAAKVTGVGFPPDLLMSKIRDSTVGTNWSDRLRGSTQNLDSSSTNAEATSANRVTELGQDGFSLGTASEVNTSGFTYINWNFRRAPGFFDVVCDTGTGSAHTITHNLGAVPELMIRKKRSAEDAWIVYANNDNTDYLVLNTTAATVDDNTMWNDTSPTSSVFTVGTNDDVNGSGATFVTYLFASVAGVSKVGSYTGTGTTKQIDCGFTGGARFVLIKRIDSTGDWYVWDTARGIVAGNDPYLLLNSTDAEVTNTDYVDTYSAGFEISSTAPAAINANGGTFIFLAIA